MQRLLRHDYTHSDGRRLFVYGPHGDGGRSPDGPRLEPPGLHLRRDDLTGRGVAISPARNTRPQSRTTRGAPAQPCPLCPGGPEVPFAYAGAVFENRFPTLLPDPPPAPALDGATSPSLGACEVVLYTATHTDPAAFPDVEVVPAGSAA